MEHNWSDVGEPEYRNWYVVADWPGERHLLVIRAPHEHEAALIATRDMLAYRAVTLCTPSPVRAVPAPLGR
jgi:hypothetical protein